MTELDKKTLDRIRQLCTTVNSGRHGLRFFAVIFRPDIYKKEGLEKWDLVISATWIKEGDNRQAYKYVFEKIIDTFKNKLELEVFLNKVVLINTSDPFIMAFTKAIGSVEKEFKVVENFLVAPKNFKINLHKACVFFSDTGKKNRRKR